MSNSPDPLPPADPQPLKPQPPKWIPTGMSQRERSSLILAGGNVLGFVSAALILSFGIYMALHEGPIDIR